MKDKLDLHGIRHKDVRGVVDRFIGPHIMGGRVRSVEIITGYSEKMKELVYEVLEEYKLDAIESEFNTGKLVVSLI